MWLFRDDRHAFDTGVANRFCLLCLWVCLCGMYSSDDSMIQLGVRCAGIGKAGVYRKLMHLQRSPVPLHVCLL